MTEIPATETAVPLNVNGKVDRGALRRLLEDKQ